MEPLILVGGLGGPTMFAHRHHGGLESKKWNEHLTHPKGSAWGEAQAKARYVMDIYDGADWTEMDIDDLKAAIEGGATLQEAAEFLCRADSVEDVARKCAELGQTTKAKS